MSAMGIGLIIFILTFLCAGSRHVFHGTGKRQTVYYCRQEPAIFPDRIHASGTISGCQRHHGQCSRGLQRRLVGRFSVCLRSGGLPVDYRHLVCKTAEPDEFDDPAGFLFSTV